MPLVHHMPEVLVVELVGFVASVEAGGSEDGEEAWVVDALLRRKRTEFSSGTFRRRACGGDIQGPRTFS